jgi:outer membrane protein OmpA-like peptidoglycan-associated protein
LFVPVTLQMAGIGATDLPVIFTNVRLASGGDMNPVSKIATGGTYVARGIKFDFDSAKLKPESMGEINALVAAMKQSPALKFEIGGHTDSDGDAAHNLKLSQDRADAVKRVMTGLDVDPARLTTKGYGATKPIADNATPAGKANNRRVEFQKT